MVLSVDVDAEVRTANITIKDTTRADISFEDGCEATVNEDEGRCRPQDEDGQRRGARYKHMMFPFGGTAGASDYDRASATQRVIFTGLERTASLPIRITNDAELEPTKDFYIEPFPTLGEPIRMATGCSTTDSG